MLCADHLRDLPLSLLDLLFRPISHPVEHPLAGMRHGAPPRRGAPSEAAPELPAGSRGDHEAHRAAGSGGSHDDSSHCQNSFHARHDDLRQTQYATGVPRRTTAVLAVGGAAPDRYAEDPAASGKCFPSSERAWRLLQQYGCPRAACALHWHLRLGSRDDAIAARRCEGDTAEGSQPAVPGTHRTRPGRRATLVWPGPFWPNWYAPALSVTGQAARVRGIRDDRPRTPRRTNVHDTRRARSLVLRT